MKNNKADMKNKKFKTALVLGAGGGKGFAHIGVLKALEEAGLKFDIIVGSSMGAIVGACYALGVSVSEIEKRALELSTLEIYDIKLPNTYGFIKGDKAEKVIRKLTEAEKTEPTFSDTKIPFACVASDIAKGELVELTEGAIIPAVRASFSVCGVFRPVEIDGRKLLDGGIFCRVPVDLARKMGADVVIAIDCLGKTMPENLDNYKYADTLARVFNLMDYQISKPEMERADYLVSLYQPTVSSIRVKNVADGIEVGYKTTKDAIPEIMETINKRKKEILGE